MKKMIVISMIISIFLLSFSGCSSNQEQGKYAIKLVDFSDSVSQATHKVEYNGFDNSKFVDEDASPTFQATLGDFVFEGNYKETYRRAHDNYFTHIYVGEDNCRLGVSDEGRIVYFRYGSNILKHIDELEETDRVYTQEECQEVALDFLANVVEVDINDYTLTSDSPTYNKNLRCYEYVYVKYADEYRTADEILIYVAEKNGLLYSYNAFMFGKMSTDIQVNFDMAEIEQQITQRLDEMYADIKDDYDEVKYSFDSCSLTMDENNKYMLVIQVSTDFITIFEDGGRSIIGEALKFVVWEN